VFNDYKVFITGTQYGNLLAWKWGGDDKKLVHGFSGHLKTVTQLLAHPTKKNLFISSSLDSTIKVWCMDVRT
jgi:WD40 repeat protein